MKTRSPINVRVRVASGPPIDLEKWLRDYIAFVMELEQNENVASPPAARLG